jgi:hypothetical protein
VIPLELIVGTVLALGALAYVLAPLFRDPVAPRTELPDPTLPSEATNAVATLREIEFDRATGKLSESDYAALKTSYTGAALAAMRAEAQSRSDAAAPASIAYVSSASTEACPVCGPRPESDAIYCSSCGRHLGGPCARCGAALEQPGARFCASCGQAVAA